MIEKNFAVITGASAGIGASFARVLAEKGYSLILVARRRERLETLAEELKDDFHIDCRVICCDLTDLQACSYLMDEVCKFNVEIFINNAGFGDCSPFLGGSLEKELRMVDVNVKAVHYLMKQMLLSMEKRGGGYILNVASSAGLIPCGPYMATYYATKSYVTSLTQAVARELKESGSPVYVGALCPGPVDTEFNRVANVEFSLKGISAESCARYGIRKMFGRKIIIIPTFYMKALIFFGRFVPRTWYAAITAMQQKKKLHGGREQKG